MSKDDEARMKLISEMLGKAAENIAPVGVKFYLVVMDEKAWAVYSTGGEYALDNARRAVDAHLKLTAESKLPVYRRSNIVN